MNIDLYSDRTQAVLGGLLGAAVIAAFWIGEGAVAAIAPALLVLGFLALVLVGRRRSETLDVMSGIGDERSRSHYQRAVAFAGSTMVWVIVGWWLVSVALGEPNETLAVLAAVGALSWAGAAIFYAKRR